MIGVICKVEAAAMTIARHILCSIARADFRVPGVGGNAIDCRGLETSRSAYR